MNPIEWLENALPNMDKNKEKVIKFIFLWQEYNYYYSQRVPSLGDKAGALSLANCPVAQKKYNGLKVSFISTFSQISSRHRDNGVIRTKLYADNDRENAVPYHINEKDSLENFLKVIYQIRCNFFHGGKMRENEDVDIQLIGWAYDCFKQLLDEIEYFPRQ